MFFVELSAPRASRTAKKYRLSAVPSPPCGFVAHWTMHLQKLTWVAKFQILTGQIEWVHIMVLKKAAKQYRYWQLSLYIPKVFDMVQLSILGRVSLWRTRYGTDHIGSRYW